MQPEFKKSNAVRRLYWQMSGTRRRQGAIMIALMLCGALAELVAIGSVIPFLAVLADAQDGASQGPLGAIVMPFVSSVDGDPLLTLTLIFVGVAIFAAALRLLIAWYSNRIIRLIGYDLGVTVFRRTLKRPFAVHLQRNSSEAIASLSKLQMVISGVLSPAVQAVIALCLGTAIIIAMLLVSPMVIGSVVSVLAIFYLTMNWITRPRLRNNSIITSRAQETRVVALQDALGMIRYVILGGLYDVMINHYAAIERELRLTQANTAFITSIPRVLIEAFVIVGFAVVGYSFAKDAGDFKDILPTLGALVIGVQRLLPMIQQVYQGFAALNSNRQILEDILEIAEEEPHPELVLAGEQLPFNRSIAFEGVSFRYNDNREKVIDSISFTLNKGERLGICGKTGSGKSTAVDIMMGLLEPTEGTMRIDDIAVTDHNRSAWRRGIAQVPQDIFLFDDSIAANIAMATAGEAYDEERVRRVAGIALVDEFVTNLPDGLLTRIGERGVQLSGGQRQRIGIARALYSNAQFLVLDEATSALDDATEKQLIANLATNAEGLTIVMIAHRLTTISNCDLVLRLSRGMIADSGSGQDVIARIHHEGKPSGEMTV